ncbi:MAG: methanogenesis marker protein 11 [Methanoregula sp.]|uniref:methanogenesis marker protein 11 n=2 Tax=Methanoregula sp. TaxID=2052170 RepID=UPI003C517D80
MVNISEPYIIRYPQIVAMADDTGSKVELVEFFDCIGGAMWTQHHYAKSPLVENVRCVGGTTRFLLHPGNENLALEGSRFPAGISGVSVSGDEIAVTYIGMGGGGVGATSCRAAARGVLREHCDPAGGGKVAAATLWLPRRQRVLIGVDDTDTSEEGATWTLVHNLARAVEDEHTSYLSHTIVQLFPVAFRTKNCVSLVAEFGTTKPESLISKFSEFLQRYTLSEKTGMAVYTGFTPSQELLDYARKVKRGEVTPDLVREIDDPSLHIVMDGRGITGAVAALPFYTRYEEALKLCNGKI